MQTEQPKAQPVLMHRLSPQAWQQIRDKLPPIYMSNDTSAHNAGFQLGVQHALNIMREVLVVES